MAHNIEVRKINGAEVASFVENGRKERAWHNLGQVFDGELTVKEALELSHADYQVEARNVYALTPALGELLAQGGMIDAEQLSDMMLDALVEGRKATMRMDKSEPLGIVSESYGIVQNRDAFQFIDTLCTGGKGDTPVIECAGVLGHGERVFITAKFPEVIQLDNKGDDISTVGKNQFNRVMEVMETGIGQDMGERGTAMWAINGLTTYFQNDRNYSSDELKFNSMMTGTAASRLKRAYDLMVAV